LACVVDVACGGVCGDGDSRKMLRPCIFFIDKALYYTSINVHGKDGKIHGARSICLPISLEDLEASGGLTVLFTCAGSRVDYALAQSSNHAGRAVITRLSCIDACTGALSLPREQIDTLWLVPSSDPSPSPCLLSRVTTILETRSNPALNKLCLLPSSARLSRHQ